MFALYIAIGLVAGTLSGLVGIGGGIIVVPALMLLANIPQLTAQGTSLALFVVPLSIFAFMNYYRAGHVDLTIALLLALGFIVGSISGSKLAFIVDHDILTKIFAVVLVLIAIRLFFK
ncbi:MAG: sulfite exporter TauE/SafE family protein [Candidatus Pacebacteria bacterium]|nr:sulfite exporter TauE/SafE family protein [Candidatus Paceibacterota bacterium]MBP9772753.1 sulfite exporter TauE/SafE family protein [Candidatus Paceibacterota bacterium]QQR76735.1 MAG: sulfite exporter TauE/SafE family protein [Candidatus Nomurabacteria bacterium]